ncbi:MAG: flagellar basal body protein [Nitrospiraceae bacterium]|nr:flagellar basal body protein [Nitrospiraceae bacterium]
MNISGISVSALLAYEKKLGVTANNIANMNTENFKPSEAATNESPHGGVYVTIRQLDLPEVDIAKEMVDLMIAKNGIQANIKGIQTGDEITRSILDIRV